MGSMLTGVLASPAPPFGANLRPESNQSVKGNLNVSGVVRINKNNSVYGKLYAHGGAQIWKGLLVRTGGVTADKLDVAGAITAGGALQVQSATIAGNLQAGAITGTSLALNGAATVNGTLSVTQKITGNGLDAGAGDITTTGRAAVGALTASSITDSGALTAASATLSGLTVSGAVNFSGATVTGLTASGLNLNNATLHALTVDQSLNVGANGATTAPLQVSENNRTAQIGVDANGNLTVPSIAASGNLAVGGSLTVAGGLNVSGTSTLSVSGLQGAPAAGQTTPGALTLTGSTIALNGPTALTAGQDLVVPTSASTNVASHIVASGNKDLAGQISGTIPASTGAQTVAVAAVTFKKAYAATPAVVVTPTSDPLPGSTNSNFRYWVSANQSGFQIMYTIGASTSAQNVAFNYVVIGS